MRALYISHNGMLEGLGQSQVLPYVRGLARRGVRYDLFSFELPEATDAEIEPLKASLATQGIRWMPLRRKRDPRLHVKIEEIARGVGHALLSAAARRPDIVHGRSYLPTAIADVIASIVPRAKLVFDCRGMLGDEYVDAGYWRKEQREYRLLKRYEGRAFHRAEGVVVLTEALRRWVSENDLLGPRTTLATIPTCVDMDNFVFDPVARRERRAELGLEGRTVVVYAGSLGELYRMEDMVRFMRTLKARSTTPVAFLVLTPSPPDKLVALMREHGLDDSLVVRKAPPRQMASYLSAGDLGLAFGKACFARLGCSPTKLAEYLACGLPVVTNSDFGDQGTLADQPETCIVIEGFEPAVLDDAATRALALAAAPLERRVALGRALAGARFGLETVGVARYEALYRDMLTINTHR